MARATTYLWYRLGAMADTPLANQLKRALPPERAATLPALLEIETRLTAKLLDARAVWPLLSVTDDRFVRHVASVLPSDGMLEALDGLVAADLLLAVGCIERDRMALAAFDAQFVVPITDQLVRAQRCTADGELEQVVREHVLVGRDGRPAKLAQYTGRAPLSAWLRVVITRLAITMLRRRTPADSADMAASDDVIANMISYDVDVELAHVRTEHSALFKQAFHEALESLPARDRTVLRMSVIDDLSIDEIAEIYRVHRATAARWLVGIREQLSVGTRQRLAERLRLADSEFESLAGMLLSCLDISLQRILDEARPVIPSPDQP